MFHIIGFIFLFIFAILIVGILILMKILRLLGIGRKRTGGYYQNTTYSSSYNGEKDSSETITGNTKKKKVFDKNEGEYIDFEDV